MSNELPHPDVLHWKRCTPGLDDIRRKGMIWGHRTKLCGRKGCPAHAHAHAQIGAYIRPLCFLAATDSVSRIKSMEANHLNPPPNSLRKRDWIMRDSESTRGASRLRSRSSMPRHNSQRGSWSRCRRTLAVTVATSPSLPHPPNIAKRPQDFLPCSRGRTDTLPRA